MVIIIVGVVVYFVYYHDGDHSDDLKDNLEKLKDAVADKYDEASKLLSKNLTPFHKMYSFDYWIFVFFTEN